MADTTTIKAIKQSGGWCQLHSDDNVALIDIRGGRLLAHFEELSFIEKLDLSANALEGYIVVINKNRQRLKKALWIKKVLSVAGKIIPETTLPESLYAETLNAFFHNLKSANEFFVLTLLDTEIKGRAIDFSNSGLTVEISSPNKNLTIQKIGFSKIVCIELHTRKIRQSP